MFIFPAFFVVGNIVFPCTGINLQWSLGYLTHSPGSTDDYSKFGHCFKVMARRMVVIDHCGLMLDLDKRGSLVC